MSGINDKDSCQAMPWQLEAEIELKVLDQRFKDGTFPLPQYESAMAAAVDLRAMVAQDKVLEPGQCELIPTGIAIFINNPFLCATILPRSGLGYKQGIVLGNLTGLIDADYQGELKVPLWNRSSEPFTVHAGDRIAQMMFLPVVRATFKEVDEFHASERGTSGFGSTGHR